MFNKKSGKKKQFLAFTVCSIIAMGVCLAVLVFTVNSVENGNSGVAEYDTESKTEISEEKNFLYNYLKDLTAQTKGNSFIKADISTSVFVDDGSVKVTDKSGNESEKDKTIITYVKNKALPTIDTYYPEDYKGEFGKAFEDMPQIDFPEDCIKDFSFSVGQTDENGNPLYDSNSGELVDGDSYFISFSIDTKKAHDKSLQKLFSLSEKEQISSRFCEDVKEICTVNKSEINLSTLKISAKINRQTDEINNITLEKIYDITADVTFSEKYSVFGNKTVSFSYGVEKVYEYYYSGIEFSESAVTVEPDSEIALSVNAVIENDSEYKVEFISSDTSVATIDEMGYVKGIKDSDEAVTVTVRLTYLGKTFEDTCLVYVNSADKSEGGAFGG